MKVDKHSKLYKLLIEMYVASGGDPWDVEYIERSRVTCDGVTSGGGLYVFYTQGKQTTFLGRLKELGRKMFSFTTDDVLIYLIQNKL